MKKKLFLLFSLFLCISLASCRGQETVPLNEHLSETAKEQLNYTVLENGVSINKDLDRTQKNFIDVIIPATPAEALVVRHVNVDGAFTEQRVKSFNVSVLTFYSPSLISLEYRQAIMSEIHNATYGITKDKLGLSVDILTGTDFSIKVPSEQGVNYYKEGKTNITLSVIYLPAKVAIINDKVKIGEITVLVPVYAEFNLGEASEVFTNYDELTLALVEDVYGDLVLAN